MKRALALICIVSLTVFFVFGFIPLEKQQQPGGKAASVARGKLIYKQYCLTCHQANAAGVPGMTPPLIKTSFVLGDKKKLITILLKGLTGEIEVGDDVY